MEQQACSARLRLQRVPHALHARARGQNVALAAAAGCARLRLPDLGQRVDQATDEADEDGANAGDGDGRVEEDQAGDRDGEFVEGAHHAVGGRRGDTDTPCGGVGDEDGGDTRDGHDDEDSVPGLGGEVEVELDALAHAQEIGGGAEAVEHHPHVARIEGGDLVPGLAARRVTVEAVERVLDIPPRGDHAAHDHQTKGQQGHRGDAATKPEHLAVRDLDYGQVLEDGVDGDAEELQGFGGGVDHADEEDGDGSPFAGLIGVEVAVGDETHGLAEDKVHVEVGAAQDIFVGDGHQDTAEAVAEDGEQGVIGERVGGGGGGRHVGGGGGRQDRGSAVGGGGGGGRAEVVGGGMAVIEFDGGGGAVVVVLVLAGHERSARGRC
nr:hypothetical protein CFP56_79220 [Quercus suber]